MTYNNVLLYQCSFNKEILRRNILLGSKEGNRKKGSTVIVISTFPDCISFGPVFRGQLEGWIVFQSWLWVDEEVAVSLIARFVPEG